MKHTKRQKLPVKAESSSSPGMLYVVATPIGNMSDLTSRAESILFEVDRVLCEDTRRTRVLMEALINRNGLKNRFPPLERLDAHASEAQLRSALAALKQGERLALVSDAGTPGVSDPGAALVEVVRKEGIEIIPIPGVSAVTTLLSVCSFSTVNFSFRGFFPRKKSEQILELEALARFAGAGALTAVWFESPHRILSAIEVIAELFPKLEVFAGKELTKVHEKFFQGTSEGLTKALSEELQSNGERGEWVFAAHFPQVQLEDGAAWELALDCLLEVEVSVSESAKLVSQKFAVSRKEAYRVALQRAGKNNEGGT